MKSELTSQLSTSTAESSLNNDYFFQKQSWFDFLIICKAKGVGEKKREPRCFQMPPEIEFWFLKPIEKQLSCNKICKVKKLICTVRKLLLMFYHVGIAQQKITGLLVYQV